MGGGHHNCATFVVPFKAETRSDWTDPHPSIPAVIQTYIHPHLPRHSGALHPRGPGRPQPGDGLHRPGHNSVAQGRQHQGQLPPSRDEHLCAATLCSGACVRRQQEVDPMDLSVGVGWSVVVS